MVVSSVDLIAELQWVQVQSAVWLGCLRTAFSVMKCWDNHNGDVTDVVRACIYIVLHH